METVSITERYGDPASFAYYGQHYQSLTAAKCALCGRDIRNVYTLRPPRGRSVPIGECCFVVFEQINPGTYTRLLAAQVLMDAFEEGTENDIKVFNARGDKDYRLREWRKLRREVLSRVRKYRTGTGSDWLPKNLHDLRAEANRKPGKTSRWFDIHIPILRNQLNAENPSL